jgi:hypothetical protein
MAFDEREMAGLVIESERGEGPPRPSAETASEQPPTDRVLVDMRRQALAETGRLQWARHLAPRHSTDHLGSVEGNDTWVARARLRATRVHLGNRIVAIFSIEDEEQEQKIASPILVPLAVALRAYPRFRHSYIREFLQDVGRDLRLHAESVAEPQRRDVETLVRTFLEVRTRREAAIVEVVAANRQRAPFQAGLFDRRADYEQLASRAEFEEAVAEAARHLAEWRRAATTRATRARLLLVLSP